MHSLLFFGHYLYTHPYLLTIKHLFLTSDHYTPIPILTIIHSSLHNYRMQAASEFSKRLLPFLVLGANTHIQYSTYKCIEKIHI